MFICYQLWRTKMYITNVVLNNSVIILVLKTVLPEVVLVMSVERQTV